MERMEAILKVEVNKGTKETIHTEKYTEIIDARVALNILTILLEKLLWEDIIDNYKIKLEVSEVEEEDDD